MKARSAVDAAIEKRSATLASAGGTLALSPSGSRPTLARSASLSALTGDGSPSKTAATKPAVRKTTNHVTLGQIIRMRQFGIERRSNNDDSVCTAAMEDEVRRNEQCLPSAELSLQHLRVRCGGTGMAAKGEIDVDEAIKWLNKASHKDIQALGCMEDPPPALQKPVQAALQYLCDFDLSWENCQSSLRKGRRFTLELSIFQPKNVTRNNLDKMIDIGCSAEAVLKAVPAYEPGLYTAVAVGVFMDSVTQLSKVRHGIPAPPPPPRIEFTAAQPRVVPFRQLIPVFDKALELDHVPLLVCNGKEDIVATFFSYMVSTVVDAKRVINEVLAKKLYTVDEMREQIRQKIMSALRYGKPLHLRMANTAMDWHTYCCDGGLPVELFDGGAWKRQDVWTKVIASAELEGCFNAKSHFVFITSDWDIAKVQEHLPSKLPNFDRLAIIDIDPNSIASG
eukprot:TRINITY_DN51976_c0_g1_i1.p1 TRINITY_DN51976_c0_g1~~TRINITY_DN51976_c0_g1_i1.p1  ORF type:complete len:451 (+),score=52.59 TRINITY_DN51976_c0_g1_i1:79-1431(+)